MKFLGISFNISKRVGKVIFPQFFHSCSCDVISPPFVYQDGGLYITSFSALNANILRTISDTEKRSMGCFLILSDLSSEINMIFG